MGHTHTKSVASLNTLLGVYTLSEHTDMSVVGWDVSWDVSWVDAVFLF